MIVSNNGYLKLKDVLELKSKGTDFSIWNLYIIMIVVTLSTYLGVLFFKNALDKFDKDGRWLF